MVEELNDIAYKLIDQKRYGEAIKVLTKSISEDKTQWYEWFLMGQCFRYLDEYKNATECIEQSVKLNQNYKSSYLALCISCQLMGDYEKSMGYFSKAVLIDEYYVEAYNSGAMTLKIMGEIEKSIDVYKQALKSLIIKFIQNANNRYDEKIYQRIDTNGLLYNRYLIDAALYVSVQKNFDKLILPSDISANYEYDEKTHGGLLWLDKTTDISKKIRILLPNYFATGQRYLISYPLYHIILGNLSTVFNLNGQVDLAEKHLSESKEFIHLNKMLIR